MAQRYSDDEMQEILRRAIDAGGDTSGFDHEDLVAAALEVGIDASAVDQAAGEIRDEREALSRVLAKQRKKRRGFFKSLATMAVINVFLYAVDVMTGGGATWFYWPLLGTSLMMAMSAIKVLPPMSEDTRDERVAEERGRIVRRRAQQARRLEKAAARRARKARRGRRASVENAFESAVEEGVTALLGALATQISRATSGEGAAPGGEPEASEFHRYVVGKKGGPRGATAGRPPSSSAPPGAARRAKDAGAPRGSADLRVAVDRAADEVVEEELTADSEVDGARRGRK